MTYFLFLFRILFGCPFKNFPDYVIPQENLIEISRFDAGQETFSINYWIQIVNFYQPYALEQFGLPFNVSKYENGQVIFRIYENNQLKILIFKVNHYHQYFQNRFNYTIKIAILEGFQLRTIDYIIYVSNEVLMLEEQQWIMFLITVIPEKEEIIIEISKKLGLPLQMENFITEEQYVHTTIKNFALSNKLDIILGGHTNINNELNLNIFKGRISKLNLISPSLWSQSFFIDLLLLCEIPKIHIKNFNENGGLILNCDKNLYLMPFETGCVCQTEFISHIPSLADVFYCVPINIYYPQFSFINVPTSGKSCSFGYFLLSTNEKDMCIACPSYSENIECIECLTQMNNWYLKPVCRSDYIFKQNNIFQFQVRLSFNYDVYLIVDFNSLTYLNGVEDFCDEEKLEYNCFTSIYNHLNNKTYLKCKKGFIINNGICTFSKEKQLVNCNFGQYHFQQNCYFCPIGCAQCQYNITNHFIQCLKCQQNYFLIASDCIKCGQFCQKCIKYLNSRDSSYYLKCVQCIDDSKYFFSFDGVNCQENKIKNCQYAYLAYKNDSSISTLDFDFIPQFNLNLIDAYCARCYDFYIFIYPSQKCLHINENSCLYGFTLEEETHEKSNLMLQNFICLLQDRIDVSLDLPKEFVYCSEGFQNCQKCYLGFQSKVYCLICKKGFYMSRINRKCYKCPLENCEICYQQNIYQEDGWKENIRPYYQFLIGKNYEDLNLMLFDSNSTEFEFKCLKCTQNYVQENGKCQIENCENQCAGCEIVNEALQYPLIKKKCIFCASNCKTCFVQTLASMDFTQKDWESQIEFYQKFQCSIFQNSEEQKNDKQITNLIDYNIQKDGVKRSLLIQQHFSCSILRTLYFSFQEVVFDFLRSFYLKNIILKITSSFPLNCIIDEPSIIQNYFKSIFPIMDVALEFDFQQTVIWEVKSNLTFLNFDQVKIKGLIIKIVESDFFKILKFDSKIHSLIQLSNITIFSDSDRFQIIILNSRSVIIDNSSLKDININNLKGLFIFQPLQIKRKIIIKDFALINCQFLFSNIFDFQLNTQNDYVELNLFIINNLFKSSLIFTNTQYIIVGTLHIFEFVILDTEISNSQGVIFSTYFLNLSITTMKVQNVTFQNADFLYLSSNSILENLKLHNNKFIGSSNFISTKKTTASQTIYSMFHFTFELNYYYSINSKFINLKEISQNFSTVTIKNIQLINNILDYKIYQHFKFDVNCAKIYIEASNIVLSNIQIYRSFGVADVSIVNSKSSSDYKIFGLHEHLDCVIPSIKDNVHSASIFIYSAKSVSIIQMDIKLVQTLNYPLFIYESELKVFQDEKEEILLKQLQVSQNLVIQTLDDQKVALFLFSSSRQVKLLIENCTVSSNILKFYQQSQILNSATIFSFDIQFSFITIKQCLFNSNLVLNGESSIIYIKSKSIQILNCTYTYNNYFQYEIIKPYLFWTINETQKVYLEDLENIFIIQSISGNGFYQAEEISIISCKFLNSEGTQGAGIYLKYYQTCSITLESIVFLNILPNFYVQKDFGSVVFINGNEESNLNLKAKNISAKYTFSNKYGGLFYITQIKGKIDLCVFQNRLIDIFFINITGKISKCRTQVQEILKVGLIQQQVNKANLSDLIELNLDGRKIIHLEQISMLNVKSIIFKNIIYESPFYLKNIQKVTVSETEIRDSVLFEYALFIQPNQFLSTYFLVESSVFLNLTVHNSIQINNLSLKINYNDVLQLKCSAQMNTPEDILHQNNEFGYNLNFSFCTKNNKSLIGLILLNKINSDQDVSMDNNQIQNINCSYCTEGLIYFQFNKLLSQNKRHQIQNLEIKNSSCGYHGCLIIKTDYHHNYSLDSINNLSIYQIIQFFVSSYFCQYNQATNGTCMNIQNINILIQKSEFVRNKAQNAGGSVYIQQSILKEQVVFQETIISYNQAQIGGGIYSNSQINLNFKQLGSVIDKNLAEFFADDIAVQPSKLRIEVNSEESELFEIVSLIQNDSYKLEMFKLKNLTNFHGIDTNYYIFPSGVQISQYKYFNWRNRTYIPINFKLRIKAITDDGVEIKDLQKSYCSIKSGIDNLQNIENINFTNNYTNYHTVYFNEVSMDYNLDNLILYFQNIENKQQALLLEFWCNSIFVPKYNKNYPYNLIQQHNSYHLRILIQTFPCQLGEIQNETISSCQTCDAENGFFSFNVNSNKCQTRDEISTKEVKPAQLNLKANFWRPYFDSSQPGECVNKNENCLGGWIEGDDSCLIGHIGALCEQCDIDNIRGSGHYFKNAQYSCSSCDQKAEQELYAIFGIIWSLITITISALSSIQTSADQLLIMKLKIIGFRIFLKQKPQSILIKIIMNYFLILSVLSSFQIQYQNKAQIFFYSTAQTVLPQSLQCYFYGTSDTEFMYQMLIWQSLLPFAYMSFFLIFYGIGFLVKKIRFNISVITTVGLYLFMYFQPNIIKDLLSMISYRNISGYFWIAANVAYRYDKNNHLIWIYKFCAPALFLFGLLTPAMMTFYLLLNRNKLDNQKVVSKWGYLFNDYNRSAYFWEILKIITKELLIFFIIFYDDFLILKCCFLILLMNTYSLLSLHFKPFNFYAFNQFDYRSGKVASYSFILLLGIYQSNNSQILIFKLPMLRFVNSYKFKFYCLTFYLAIFSFKNKKLNA